MVSAALRATLGGMRELLFPPGTSRHDLVLDAVLAVALGLLTVPPYGLGGFADAPDTIGFAAAILMIASLFWRRLSPLLALAGVTLAGIIQLLVSSTPMVTLVAVPVVVYSVARWVPGQVARIALVIGALWSIVGPVRWLVEDPGYLSLRELIWLGLAVLVCLGMVITPYAVGRRELEVSRIHQERVEVAEERYRQTAVEREHQTRLAESLARNQIARELHDIVAHSLSVMIVQAEGGRAAAAKRPEAAAEALATIAETGRESLAEMRRILGVLRADPQDSGEGEYQPSPRLTEIPEMVARASDRIKLEIQGKPPRVSAALELTVFRVVQEALTNFLKHAGPQAEATVAISYSDAEIAVEVVDNGVASEHQPPISPGHGLRGMQERVLAMGGRVLTQPRPSGGFQVMVTLPVITPTHEGSR